jgi:hypothetical protein
LRAHSSERLAFLSDQGSPAIHNLPMNPVPGYAGPSQRVGDQVLGGRWSAPTQSLVSAALVLPTIVVWYLRWFPSGRGWDEVLDGIWIVALTLVLDGYFVVVVTLLARSSGLRVPALVTAIAATVIDVGDAALVMLAPYSDAILWADRGLTVVILMLFVSAWGISRRRSPVWVIGLAPALLIAILLDAVYASTWLYDNFTDVWIVFWALWIGGFLLCCVICWGFDVLGAAVGRKADDAAGPQPAPVQGVSGYPQPFAYPMYQPVPQTNSMAITALVCSLVLAPLGIVFGHVALSQIKRTGEEGRGLAISGLLIGYITTALLVVSFLFILVLSAWLGASVEADVTATL